MTEPRRADLSYGQLGEAIYDSESQEWHFARSPGIAGRLQPVGEFSIAIEASLDSSSLQIDHSAAARTHDIKDLTLLYPEIYPSIPLLPELVLISEVINSATSTHDPVVSELLAFGKAADLDNQRSGARTVPIAAIPGGEAGEAVRLVRLAHDYLGWLGHRTVGLKTPTLSRGDQGWWVGNGSPIQQLCFAETEGEPSTWLAVRYSGATTILRPLLRRSPVPVTFANGPGACRKGFSSSRIDANLILTLPIERTGGAPHADVSFNPWNERQFAVIDQQGRWTIWNIEGQHRRRHTFTAIAGPDGLIRVADVDSKDHTAANARADGWGSIFWAGDMCTIVVADRRTFAVFDVKAHPKWLAAPELHVANGTDWILDVKRSPVNHSHVFVVTSSRIICLRILGVDEDEDVKDPEMGAELLFSTRHFRDQDDISLRLHVLKNDGALTALLYSRLTTLCTAFTVSMLSSVSDPSIVPLFSVEETRANTTKRAFNTSPSVLTLILRPAEFANRGRAEPSGPGLAYVQNAISFHKLFVLYNDMSLREGLYYTTSAFPPLPIQPPDTKRRFDTTRSSIKVLDDDFVIADGLAVDESDGHSSESLSSRSHLAHAAKKTIEHGEEDQWSVNLEWLYEEIETCLTVTSSSTTEKLSNAGSFNDCLVELETTIKAKSVKGQQGIDLLSNLLDVNFWIDDIDMASSKLQDFLSSIGQINTDDTSNNEDADDATWQPRAVALFTTQLSCALFRRNYSENKSLVNLSDAYGKLLHSWVAPLSSSMPGKVRIAIEKVLRKVVVQLCFASLGVRLGPRAGASKQIDGHDAMDLAKLALPVREKGITTGTTDSGKGQTRESPTSTQSIPPIFQGSDFMHELGTLESSLPTPDPTPSLPSRSSISSQNRLQDPSCERLKTLASLGAQRPLPASMLNLLSHWAVGADPANYDWDATRRALATASDTEGTGDEAQAKKRQRMEKRLKRQRQDTADASSQPQVATGWARWGSQPEPARATQARQGRSQVTESGERLIFPMSQVEPGPYGGRHATAAKPSKRRKHGF